MSTEWHHRKAMADIGRRVHAAGLVAATDGNISIRLGPDRILVTAAGCSLGELDSPDMIVIDLTGRKLTGQLNPTSEYRLHLAVYEVRPDAQAVIHAHPPIANAFTFAGVSLEACVVPEVVATIGPIPTTQYATPSTAEGAAVARDLIRNHDVLMLERHGSVTLGPNLRDAYHKLEKLEHTAKVLLAARSLGGARKLSRQEVQKLAAMRESLGLGSAEDLIRACEKCTGCPEQDNVAHGP